MFLSVVANCNVLGKEVLLKRASDIRSCWVGETEKKIASSFTEAQETDSILFFDEADTFLFPRKSARQSWEISFTNEILTQLESFKGTVFFATNDMDGLDHAALRRFKFKIEFKPLTPEGNLIFYNTLLRKLVSDSKDLSTEEVIAIKGIKNLTPGDFAVVKDQMSFADPSSITHEMLIEALSNEVRYKKIGKAIGF
ncbi:MAG: ATP-binding protein [Nitrospirae bacterium]|nr:ATP-binding protein [Nitrospirota bacterium]